MRRVVMTVIEELAKNFRKGDPLPPRTNLDLLRVYNFQLCPYVERVLLVLEAKGVPYETVNVNLRDKPEWLYEKHPQAKVPAIEFDKDNKVLVESLVISDFLDEQYSDVRPLRARDPYQRAQDRLFVDHLNEYSSTAAKIYHSSDELSVIWEKMSEALKKLENNLSKRLTNKYLSGDSAPGMVDYMIWPFIERIPSGIAYLSNSDYSQYLETELPTIDRYRKQMLTDSAVSKIAIDPEVHQEFAQLYRTPKK